MIIENSHFVEEEEGEDEDAHMTFRDAPTVTFSMTVKRMSDVTSCMTLKAEGANGEG